MIRLDPQIAARLEAAERLIVPSRQRAAAVRLAFTLARRDQDAPWATPQVISRRAWLRAEAGARLREGAAPYARVLEPQEEWLAWRHAAQLWLGASGLDVRGALGAEALADALQRSCALAVEWGVPLARLRVEPSAESRCLAEAIGIVEQFAHERDALAGHEIWHLLQSRGLGEATVTEYSVGALPTAWARLTASRWRPLALGDGAPAGVRVERVATARDPADEVLRTAAWCRRRLERDPWARLLVVVPDLGARRATIERVFREVLAPQAYRDGTRSATVFAIEGGVPLADYAEPREALESLHRLTRPGDDETLAAFLEGHFWDPGTRSMRAHFAGRLRASGLRRLWPREFSARLRQLVAVDSRAGENERVVADACAQRIDGALEILARAGRSRCRRALRTLGFPWTGDLDSDREQVRRHWEEWLEQVEPRAFAGRDNSLAEAIDVMRHLARRERFAPSSGDVPVTVTAALEPPVVRYDGIRVLGLQADRWPEPVSLDPFLPISMQRVAGMPGATPEHRGATARSMMDDWRGATDELVWSWAQGEEEAIWQPSPLLAAQVADAASPRVPINDLAARLRASSTVALESYVDEQGAPYGSNAPIPGGSAALIDQAECPFRAYARHRLGARTRQVAEPGVSALERGRFLHRALWHLWSSLGDSSERLASDDGGAIEDAIAQAVAELRRDRSDPLESRWIERETERARQVLGRWREFELTRPPFRVVVRESPIELLLGPMRIGLQIDRADRLEDGSLIVLDYKTGAYRRLTFDGPLLDAIQLWLYAEAIEQRPEFAGSTVRAVGHLHLQGSGASLAAVSASDGGLPQVKEVADWESLRREARTFLEGLVRDFSQGWATVAPRADACRYCDLSLVCRRSVVLDARGISEESEA